MKHDFLKSLELPKTFAHQLPSIRFESGLSDHNNLRGHELAGSNIQDYQYYGDETAWFFESSWRNHDARLYLETQNPEASDYCPEYYDAWSFDAIGDFPARVLGSIAYSLGWRLVPYARWVGKRVGDQSISHYVEQHCRQWAEDADTVFHLLQGQKINRRNAPTQKALILPIRQRAERLIRLTLNDLASRV